MKNSFGRVFETLSSRANKEIKESFYANEVFLSSRWSFLENSIVSWSTHYKKYVLLLLILSFLVVCNLVMWQPWIKPFVPQYIPNWKSLLEWQGAFIGGQLTIIGVVYPLVIGLVSILFQNKSAKKIIFPIYQKYSGFMFAGLSGLALSGFIIVGYFLRAIMGDSIYVCICITSAMWLSVNLFLTAWFFVKTFRMLDENSRDAIIFRYSINESCEIDVSERIKSTFLQSAIHLKLLINPNEKVLEVLTYKYSNNNYQEITRIVKRDKSLKDVRLWLVNIAILLQISILKRRKIEGCKLVVQPLRSSRSSNIMSVAKYDGFEINPLVQLLIKSAFSFRKDSFQSYIGLSSVLNGFVGPANDALRGGDAKEFSGTLDNLALWHTEVAQALSFENDDGELDNWLLLSANGMGLSYLDELLGEYYRLAREVVERIPENSRFYTDMLYLHKRIFVSRDVLINKEMRSLIQGSYSMWYLLVEWRSYNSESSDIRIANKYEDILYDFVGAWESWLMYIEPRSKRAEDIDKAYRTYITHLEFTASTAISALRFNNFEAAGWGIDMLNNWLEQFSDEDHWNEEYLWRSMLINHNLLSSNSVNAAWRVILRGHEYNHIAASNLAFKNAHLDLRIITACYVLLKPGDDQHDLLAKYVKSLLSGASIHPTGSIGRPINNIGNAGELLGAYIRHRDYLHFGDGRYGGWLSSILESFGRIYEERRVSGRIYSGWWANDPRSMNKAYVEIGISLSESRWSLTSEWSEVIMSGTFRHMDQESIISDLRDWIKIANENHDYILVDARQQKVFKANFIASVEGIIHKVGEAQNHAVVKAEIDKERLNGFGVAASALFMNENKPVFPLALFEHVDREAELDDSSFLAVNILNYSKERIAVGIDTNRVINEDDRMGDWVTRDLKSNILKAIIRYPQSESSEYSDINNILSDIQNMSKSMACPVLFVGNIVLSNALFRSFYERELAGIYDISRQDGFDKEYICHIGDCEVYKIRFSDVDYCILTSKELFDTLEFRKLADDRYVDVDFELDDDSEIVGKLKLKYWMNVNLTENISCIKLDLTMKDENLE
ncbi:MAG: hypothetical protein JKY50_11990 [Oleispira sp.]|nr:hypothetical protein [Oleispira sp.]